MKTYECVCGYKVATSEGGGATGTMSCCCGSCRDPNAPIIDSLRPLYTSEHMEHCAKKKAADEEAAKKAAEEKEKENAKPAAPTHDASGYPLAGKCVCGYDLHKYDHPPENGKCMCYICAPGAVKSHYGHCLQQLKEKLAETQKTVGAQDGMLTVKNDRIAEMQKTIDAYSHVIDAKHGRVAELEVELENKKRQVREMIGPHNSAVEKLDEKDRTIHKHLQVIDTLNATVSRLEDRLAEKDRIINTQRQNMEGYVSRIAELEGTVGKRDKNDVMRKKDIFIQSQRQNIRSLSEKICELEEKNRVAEKAIAGLERQINERPMEVTEDAPTSSHVKDLEQEIERLKAENEELKKRPPHINTYTFKVADDTPPQPFGSVNVDYHMGQPATITLEFDPVVKLQEQIQTLRAQMEGLEHDKATLQDKVADLTNDLDKRTSKWHNLKTRVAELESEIACRDHDAPLVDWLHMEQTKNLKIELASADASRARLHKAAREQDKIILTYSKQISEKDCYITELEAQMVYFKKYRKWMINMIAARVNKSACNLEDTEPFLAEFPELREPVIKLVVFARKFQAFSGCFDQQLTDKQRISSIRYARQLEQQDGGEHSPASGSTPESS